MFTSNGLNPYPQYYCTPSSSSYNPTPPIVNQDVSPDHDLFFHQNHQDPLSAPFLLHNTQIPQPAALMNLASFPNAAVSAMTSQDHNETCVNLLGKKTTKKDRHSKIYTAHGLRDRRVRLSIEIAREFFDLQDMLGFDKASKTVEWLLSKSKSSIKELEMSQSSNVNNEMAIDHNGDLEGILGLSRSKYSMMGDVSDMMSQEDGLNAIAKDSRAKARARARERTKEKILCTGSTCEQDYSNLSPQMLNQFKAMNHYQLEDHSHRSSFCSMTDMNLSTELQINGRNY